MGESKRKKMSKIGRPDNAKFLATINLRHDIRSDYIKLVKTISLNIDVLKSGRFLCFDEIEFVLRLTQKIINMNTDYNFARNLALINNFYVTWYSELKNGMLCDNKRLIDKIDFLYGAIDDFFSYKEIFFIVLEKTSPDDSLNDKIKHLDFYEKINTIETDKVGLSERILNGKKNTDGLRNFLYEKGINFSEKNIYNVCLAEVDPKIFFIEKNLQEIIPENLKNSFLNIIGEIVFINNIHAGLDLTEAYSLLSYDDYSFSLKKSIFEFVNGYVDFLFGANVFYEKNSIVDIFVKIADPWMKYFDTLMSLGKSDEQIGYYNTLVAYYINEFKNAMLWKLYFRTIRESKYFSENSGKIELFSAIPLLFNTGTFKSLAIDSILKYQKIDFFKREFETIDWFMNNEIYLSRETDKKYQEIIKETTGYKILEFKKSILSIANDLREICHFFLPNYDPSSSIHAISCFKSAGWHAIWQWETDGDCLAKICLDSNGRSYMIEQISKKSRKLASYNFILRVNYNGLISLDHIQFIDSDIMLSLGFKSVYDLNFYLIKLFSDFFSNAFFNSNEHKVDLVKKNVLNEADLIVINQNYLQNLEYLEVDIVSSSLKKESVQKTEKIRHMKSDTLFKILEKNFGCSIKNGKGSEINISRVSHGGKIFRLGHHGKTVEVSSIKISKILDRLNITKEQWRDVLLDS